MFSDPSPKLGDSDNILLAKILQMWSALCVSSRLPRHGDSDNNLLFKLASGVSDCGCTDPLAPSGLSATPPAPETTVSWTDNATNETGYELRYRNLTQGGGFSDVISYPADSTSTGTGVIIVGANDGDEIEISVRAVSGSCVSAWVTITEIAVIGI